MTTYIEATFLAKNDPQFHFGHGYQLQVRQHWGGKLSIVATQGYNFKEITDTARKYPGLGAFLQEWQTIRVVEPEAIRTGAPTA